MGVSWFGREPKTAAMPPALERFQGLGEITSPVWAGSSKTLTAEQVAMSHFARTNGLARFSVSIVADTGSRVLLVPEEFNKKTGEWERSDNDFANVVLMMLRGLYTDQQQTIWYHLYHRRVTGERYQVRELDPATMTVTHSVYGPLAVERLKDSTYIIKDRANEKGRRVGAQDVQRMWWVDPDWPLQPWSPLWAGLSDLERFHLLGRVISRTASSALLARGVFWVPKEGLGRMVTHRGKQRRELQAGYYDAANDKLTAADDSVAAIVPYMMFYGNDYKSPELIKFDIPFDGNLLPMRAEALESWARASDLPSALLVNGGSGAGQADGQRMNHITDLLVDRRYFDHTVAPQVDAVLHADLTNFYLRPALRNGLAAEAFQGDPEMFRIGYDPSPVIIPADKSQTALIAFRSGLLSMDSALRALGFKPEDAPTPEELTKIIELMQSMNQGIRAGDNNLKNNGQGPQGTVNANGQGTAVKTPA